MKLSFALTIHTVTDKHKAITIQKTNNSDHSKFLAKLAEFAIFNVFTRRRDGPGIDPLWFHWGFFPPPRQNRVP